MLANAPRFRSGAGILAAFVLVTALLDSPAGAQVPSQLGTREWRRRSIAATTFNSTSLALDGEGHPHFGFQSPNIVMAHAQLDGRRKVIERVDPRPDNGFASAVAIDSTGSVHLAYVADLSRDGRGFRLIHALAPALGGAFTLTEIDSGGFSPSMAIDAADRPHIAYVDTQSCARYAFFDGDSWRIVTLAGGALDFGKTSIALADSGAVHVTFSDGSLPRRLFHATIEGEEIEVEYVADGRGGSLALDRSGTPHVAFSPEISVLYARRMEGAWVVEEVDGEEIRATAPSLALDADDRPHIAYAGTLVAGERSRELTLYAWRDGSSWSRELVDKSGGFDVHLALDASQVGHVSYRKGSDRSSRLRYAVRKQPAAE